MPGVLTPGLWPGRSWLPEAGLGVGMGERFSLSGPEAASAHLWAPSPSLVLGSWALSWDLPLPPPSLGFLLLTGPSAFSYWSCGRLGHFSCRKPQRPQRPPWRQYLLPWRLPARFVIVFQVSRLLCAASSLVSAVRLANAQNICFAPGPGPGSWVGGARVRWEAVR